MNNFGSPHRRYYQRHLESKRELKVPRPWFSSLHEGHPPSKTRFTQIQLEAKTSKPRIVCRFRTIYEIVDFNPQEMWRLRECLQDGVRTRCIETSRMQRIKEVIDHKNHK